LKGEGHCIVPIYLGRVLEIERVIESKVHKAHESGIELHESQHHPEVNVSGHLRKNNRTVTTIVSTIDLTNLW
jgi:hypothetical protein